MSRCRYIQGEAEDIRLYGDAIFCGAPTASPSESWCDMHRAIIFVKPSAKVRREPDEHSV
jgi:hypothetical protein